MTKVILGDNQFFGINHADLKKGKETQSRFITSQSILEFIDTARHSGIDGFMINSNQLGYEVVKNYPFDTHNKFECHYSIPYPHKYAGIVNESGMLSLMKYVLHRVRLMEYLDVIKFVLTRNVIHLLGVILRLEIPSNLPKGSVVYLQNVVTDMLMGLPNGNEIINAYNNKLKKLGYQVGFITLNPTRFYKIFGSELVNERIYLCFNFNKSGFNVFPNINEVSESIESIKKNTRWNTMAMSVFSSGGVTDINECISFIGASSLDYVVFGSSNMSNIRSNILKFNLILETR